MRMKPILERRVPGGASMAGRRAWSRSTSARRCARAAERPRAQRVGFWVTGIVIFVGWNLTTLLGALIGDAIGDAGRAGSMPQRRRLSSACCGRG